MRGMHVNSRLVALAAGLWTIAMVAGIQSAYPQPKSATDIAVVDVQFLMSNSNAAKNARVQIERTRAEYQQEVKRRQEDLNRLYQSIARERPTLSEEAYQQRLAELRQKGTDHERDVDERESKLRDALRGVSEKIAATIVQIVNEIIKEKKLTLVLPRSTIIGTPAVPDITQEVLKRLDHRAPFIPMDLPK